MDEGYSEITVGLLGATEVRFPGPSDADRAGIVDHLHNPEDTLTFNAIDQVLVIPVRHVTYVRFVKARSDT